MRSKQLKYVLITAVCVVWGVVVYKIIRAQKGENIIPAVKIAHVSAHPAIQDSFSLIANYPDPFLGSEIEDTVNLVKENPNVVASVVQPKPPETPLDLSFIQYHGIIVNPAKKIKVAIIQLNGKELLVREKEEIGEVIFIQFGQNDLKIRYRDKLLRVRKVE